MAIPDHNGTPNSDNNYTTTGSGFKSEDSTTSGSSSGSGTSRTRESFQQDNMSDAGRAALDQLIAQLLAGGSPEQRQALENSLREQQANQALREQFSQERALQLSEGLINQSIALAMQEALPQLALSAQASGSQGDALTALLTQQTAAGASRDAAALGAQQVTDFGNIQVGFSGVLEDLVNGAAAQDNVTELLIQALNVDKGSRQSGTRTSTTKSKESRSSTSRTRVNSTSSTKGSKSSGDSYYGNRNQYTPSRVYSGGKS